MSETKTISSTGRRKTAVARLQMKSGTGKITVNGRLYDDYFPTISLQNSLLYPFQVANCFNKYDVNITAQGGGISGQIGAIRLAIARALIKNDPELRSDLKEKGLLKRDPRMKERKKSGQPGARKRFQFSKR